MKKVLFFIIINMMFLFNVNAIEINSKNAYIYNMDTDKVLYEKNSDEEIKIASLTKIMTALIVIENNNDLNKEVTIQDSDLRDMYEYSTAGFQAGDVLTLKDVLYGIILPSGSDAVNAAVRITTKNEKDFIDLMNQKVKELGLTHTHFSNAIGKDDDNYSTVSDLCAILNYALKNDKFREIYTNQVYNIESLNLNLYGPFEKAKTKYDIDLDYIKGAKSGYTTEAKHTMSSYSDSNGFNILVVTAFAENYKKVLEDTDILYKYVYDNYENIDYDISFNIDIINSDTKKYSVIMKPKLFINKNYDESKLTYKYEGKDKINYLIKKGDKLGTVKIYYDGKVIDEENVFLNKKITYQTRAYYKPIIIALSLILLSLILFIIISNIKRKKIEKRNRIIIEDVIKEENNVESRINNLKQTLDIEVFFKNISLVSDIKERERMEIDFIDRSFENTDYTNLNCLSDLYTKFKLYRNKISDNAYTYFAKTMKYCLKNMK